jgi:HSP20 family protein
MTTVWNPVRDMITLREALDQAFNERWARDYHQAQVWQLPIDAFTSEDAIVIKANVPGLKPEDLQITLEGDTLTIRGELKNGAETRNYLLRERANGKFERVLTINTPLDANKVEANFEEGVLTLTLPKAETVKPKQIKVNAKNGQPQVSAN